MFATSRQIRDATAKFKTTEAAETAGYKQVTGCVEHQPASAMGYHFQINALLDTTLDLEAQQLALALIEAPSPSSLLGKNHLSVKPAVRTSASFAVEVSVMPVLLGRGVSLLPSPVHRWNSVD